MNKDVNEKAQSCLWHAVGGQSSNNVSESFLEAVVPGQSQDRKF